MPQESLKEVSHIGWDNSASDLDISRSTIARNLLKNCKYMNKYVYKSITGNYFRIYRANQDETTGPSAFFSFKGMQCLSTFIEVSF